MLDLQAIETSIKELETGDTTFVNCEKLASLYIVKEHLKGVNTQSVDDIANELYDLLPSYDKYRDKKRKQQLHEVPEDACIHELSLLCREIEEFIIAIYAGTTMSQERRILVAMLNSINKKVNK